jgi:CBS domain-containing protein
MNCPSCGSENIDGSDRCENCLAPFRNLDVPHPDSAEGLDRHVMADNLGRLHPETPVIVSGETPVIDVLSRMKEVNSGCALVVDNEKLAGIFTEHDLLVKVFQEPTQGGEASSEVWQTAVQKFMTPNPETLHEDESVAFALNKMSLGRYRHIPIVKSDGNYTVASIKSVLNYIASEDW